MLSANILLELGVANSVGRDLWVSLQNLDSVLQSVENLGQALSALGNIWRLAEELGHLRVALSGVVEIELQRHFGLSHEEIADSLGHRVSDGAQDNFEVLVDTLTHLLDEHGAALARVRHVRLLHDGLEAIAVLATILELIWLTRMTALNRRGATVLGDDGRALLSERLVVGEMVVLLRVNEGFGDLERVVTLLAQRLDDDVHDLVLHARESHEHALNDAACNALELTVRLIDEVERGSLELSKLGRDQVREHIDRGEAGEAVTLVKLDGVLNISIAIVGRGLALEFRVQLPEALLDLGTATELSLAKLVVLQDTLVIEATTNGVLVCVEELVDHVPQQLNFVLRVAGHGRSEIAQVILASLNLLLNFLRDERQVDLDVRKEDLSQLLG